MANPKGRPLSHPLNRKLLVCLTIRDFLLLGQPGGNPTEKGQAQDRLMQEIHKHRTKNPGWFQEDWFRSG